MTVVDAAGSPLPPANGAVKATVGQESDGTRRCVRNVAGNEVVWHATLSTAELKSNSDQSELDVEPSAATHSCVLKGCCGELIQLLKKCIFELSIHRYAPVVVFLVAPRNILSVSNSMVSR